jgi:hypothetical protein
MESSCTCCIVYNGLFLEETLLNHLYRSPYNQFPVFYCFFEVYIRRTLSLKSVEIIAWRLSSASISIRFCPFLDILQDYPPLQVLQSFRFLSSVVTVLNLYFFLFSVQKQERSIVQLA